MRKTSKGFTLVEIMIVVAVVGVGAGIALVNMSEQVAEAKAQADGEAMAQRIQVEQRAARERMVGLRLKKDLTGKLEFEDVLACNKPTGFNQRYHAHLATTELNISTGATTVCWDRNGQIDTSTVTVTGPQVTAPVSGIGADDVPELDVRAGIKRIRTRKLRTTLAGPISAVVDGVAASTND